MNENVEPYILYVSKNFLDQANKTFKLGFIRNFKKNGFKDY
ncbi:MAG: hypothetical protein QW755_06785 [Nitrososphaerota archaeon]